MCGKVIEYPADSYVIVRRSEYTLMTLLALVGIVMLALKARELLGGGEP